VGQQDPTGYGEGVVYLFGTEVTTDGAGHAAFNLAPQAATVAVGERVTATATRMPAAGVYADTSEFSAQYVATGPNAAPVNALPAAPTINEDAVGAIAGLSVGDADGNLLRVQLVAAHGTLGVDLAGGARLAAGTNGSASIALTGTQAQINTALATLTYRGNADAHGADTVTVLSTDAAGDTDSDVLVVNVTAVNDAPTFAAGTGPARGVLPADPDSASAVLAQADGRLLLVGQADRGSGQDIFVTRYLADGRVDTAFGTGGTAYTDIGAAAHFATAAALLPDGDILVAGYTDDGAGAEIGRAHV
jgi:hypothetical protein